MGSIKKEVALGQEVYPFYGMAYYDNLRQVAVCYPIPLNWIVAIFRNIYWKFMYAPDLKNKELIKMYNEGYCDGIADRKRERGQSLVELALSITILMLLLSGLIEFGMIFFQFVQLRDAAQEGALYGSISPNASEADIILRAKGASNSPIDLQADPNLEVVVTYPNDNGLPEVCEGDGVKVTMNYGHKVFMPFLSQFLGTNTVVISASVTDTLLVNPC